MHPSLSLTPLNVEMQQKRSVNQIKRNLRIQILDFMKDSNPSLPSIACSYHICFLHSHISPIASPTPLGQLLPPASPQPSSHPLHELSVRCCKGRRERIVWQCHQGHMKRSPQDKKKRKDQWWQISPCGSVQKDPLVQPHGSSTPSPATTGKHPTATASPQGSTQRLATARWLSSSGYPVGDARKFPTLDTEYAIWMTPFHGPCFVTDTCRRRYWCPAHILGALPGVVHLKPALPDGPEWARVPETKSPEARPSPPWITQRHVPPKEAPVTTVATPLITGWRP